MAPGLAHGMRAGLLFAVALALAVLACAGDALAAGPVLLDGEGSDAASYGGWAAWSRPDPATGEYELITRSPSGVTGRAPVAERAAPFDVELGPSAGGVSAVYSRCADVSSLKGCRIYRYTFGGAAEVALQAPGSSVHEPAIWDGELVYLRSNPSGGTRRPDNLFAWHIGSSRASAQELPVSRGLSSGEPGRWPKGSVGEVSGLTLHGQQIAYSTNRASESFAITSLWLAHIGGPPRLVDQVTSGAGTTCEAEFLSPEFIGPWLYAYLHACDPSANPALDRWTRYSLDGRSAQRARFTFVHTGDEEINAVTAAGSGVDWSGEGGVHDLAHVGWSAIQRPVPETFCSLANPVC
jgi:hypothetical protein